MRILLVSGIYRPEVGGPATYLPFLANSLLANGHSVEVVTLKHSKFEGLKERWPIHYINRDQKLFIRVIQTCLLIYRLARKSDYIFSNGLYLESAIALRFTKVKSLAKIVGDPVYERESNKGRTPFSRQEFNSKSLDFRQKVQRKMLKISLNSFDKITCPSKELEAFIKSWGIKKPIHLIVNGVDEISELNFAKNYDVVTVSRLIALKNIDYLIEACALNKYKLAIVGVGTEEKRLKRLAIEKAANVTFLGLLQGSEVIEVLAKSRIFALLSDYEGLSFSLLQAMSVGLPSLVSNVRGNADVIENGKEGIIVNPKDLMQISNAIGDLILNENLRIKMGSAAKLKIRNYYSTEKHLFEMFKIMDLGVPLER
jgi:glycosyltransferase involved in cell wall biosynthesis